MGQRLDTSEKQRLLLGAAVDMVLAALEPLDARSRQTVLLAVCYHLGIDLPAIEQKALQLWRQTL